MALPRYGRGDEVAAMVSYLAGPESGFITGASSRRKPPYWTYGAAMTREAA